jgi:ABC-type cobalamin/Fe3+-siderophores transport system ATPase subunit
MNLEITVKNYRCFNEAHPARLHLSRGTTAFIGTNNAGKSTLLRLFYELRPLFQKLAADPATWIQLLNESRPAPDPLDVEDRQAIFHRHGTGDLVVSVRILDCDYVRAKPDPHPYIVPHEIDLVLSRKNFHIRARIDGQRGRFQQVDGRSTHPRLTGGESGLVTVSWPVLRDLFASLADTFFIGPYRALRPLPSRERSFDLHLGGTYFEDMLRHQEARKADYEAGLRRLERDMKSIFQFQSFKVAREGTPAVLHFEINKERYRIDELGSGVGQVFLILGQAYLRRPAYLFIDEPECHLHPSIQAEFITALNGYTRKALFLATHSMGLARTASDRIYQVTRHASDRFTTVRRHQPGERLSEVLGEINFSVQQQAGCKKVLLVEGPTEVKAIRQFLRHLGHDRQVVILPLGGSSMINSHRDDELIEIARICPDVYGLIDSEKPAPDSPLAPERRGFLQSCAKAGITCHILERRSLENYLTRPAIHKALGRGFRELGPHDDVKRRYAHWPKADNWKVVQAMSAKDFADTDLGRFLRSVIEAPCRTDGPSAMER